MLDKKNIVIGVTGGIAVYKVVEVVSRLKKLNANVDVIMTAHAAKFVTPLTFQSISHNPVTVDMFSEPKTWDVQHISLAQKADLILIAPATANILGKVANGIADDMLTTTIMAATGKVLFAPAMNHVMYDNPIVKSNINKLSKFGYHFMEAETGHMACGTVGQGRLPEPSSIVDKVLAFCMQKKDFEGKRVLVTAGPTREPLDPVRYISNHSSGKMGYAISEEASRRGAEVKLVSGPVSIKKPQNVNVVDVVTAQEMYDEVMHSKDDFDIFIMVAAVADYRCAKVAPEKIKKSENKMTLELVKNPDIAKSLGSVKKDGILVGFSAETHDVESYAIKKLEEKNMDMIVANDVTMEGAGFSVDTNIVKIIKKDGSVKALPQMDKTAVAKEILDEIFTLL